MLTFSFTVGTPDEARTAAEVCDFLAERLTPGAAPSTRRARSSKPAETVQLPNDKPASEPDAKPVVDVKDPVALYAALTGQPVTEAAAPAAADTATPAAAEPETRDSRLAKIRDAVKVHGGKWFGDYVKAHNPTNKKLSDFTDEELDHLHAATVSGVVPPAKS